MNVEASAIVAQQGVALVGLQVPKHLGWIFREQFTSDYGIDAEIEVVAEEKATGRLLALQIKSGPSWFDEPVEDGWVFRPKPEHVAYWTAHSLPVLVVLVDLQAEVAYWQLISDENLTSTGIGWKITIPNTHTISEAATEILSEAADGDPYTLRLRQLQLARPWMVHLEGGGRIAIAVEEWINKTFGRAAIEMTALTEDGDVMAARVWPLFMLPFADYAVELPRLFPWASLSVDEESDDLHNQYEAECGHWDPEDEMYFYSHTFNDWLSSSPHSAGLHPVADDGEIATWMLDASLGELGRAFLVADRWLSQDQLPPLA